MLQLLNWTLCIPSHESVYDSTYDDMLQLWDMVSIVVTLRAALSVVVVDMLYT